MPKRKASSNESQPVCYHPNLVLRPSDYILETTYTRPTAEERQAATLPFLPKDPWISRPRKSTSEHDPTHFKESYDASPSTFPPPLVLPRDDLAMDPHQYEQNLRLWLKYRYRNKVTPERRTIYVAPPPEVAPDLKYMKEWAKPRGVKTSKSKIRPPKIEDIVSYLEAFYHELPVKILPGGPMKFTSKLTPKELRNARIKTMPPKNLDPETPLSESQRSAFWLQDPSSLSTTAIRVRPVPSWHNAYNPPFSHQLQLDDLLEATEAALPDDAYCLLLLMDLDIYHEESDEFCCGLASITDRIGVVGIGRYNPLLDSVHGVEREHQWPASHCEQYMERCCDEASESESDARSEKKKRKVFSKRTAQTPAAKKENESIDIRSDLALSSPLHSPHYKGKPKVSPMHAALQAYNSLPHLSSTTPANILSGLYLGRVLRTAAHEIGHCFAIGHCVYYACSMQGSATIKEDPRQPPYLCPVDLAKVLCATNGWDGRDQIEVMDMEGREKEWYRAMLRWLEGEGRGNVHLFASFAAWIRGRLENLESER
jgi:archaemetzincin